MKIKEFLEKDAKTRKEIVEKAFEEAEKIQEEYSPFITLNKFDGKIEEGKLKGMPVSFKDSICTKGIRTTAGSKILMNYVPPFDAHVVEKIKENGGKILGKTAMDEFGFGSFCINTFIIPKNAYDKERVSGGSSGGAATLTAKMNYPHIAIAESTGGSITTPASFNGVYGLTPTYGRVSRYGLIDYSNSLDKIGIMSKEIFGIALGLEIIAGKDPRDMTSANVPVTSYSKIGKPNKKLKVGIIKNTEKYTRKEIFSEIMNKLQKNNDILEIHDVEMNTLDYALYSYYIIAMAEASTNLSKYCGLRYGLQKEIEGNYNEYFSKIRAEGFGDEAKRRIIIGTFVRMAGYKDKYYEKALKVRTLVINEFSEKFKDFDLLVLPSTPNIAPKFEEVKKIEPIEAYKFDILTIPPNLAGLPHLTIPIGKLENMPIGMQVIANKFEEEKLISFGYIFEND